MSLTMREIRYLYCIGIVLVLAVLLAGMSFSGTEGFVPAATREALEAAAATATPAPTPAPTATPTPTSTPAPLTVAALADHPALIAAEEDGLFHAEQTMTRRELFETLSHMLDGLPRVRASAGWSDYGLADSGYWDVAVLRMMDLLPDTATFRPDDPVTRGELAGFLDRLATHMTGQAGELVRTLSQDVSHGALSQSGTAASSAETLTRGELAVILETLAGREPDGDSLFLNGLLPPDLTVDGWAWDYMADAATEGPVTVPEPGVYRLYGWLYGAGEDGSLVRDETYSLWSFDSQGRYTTGDAELDEYLAQALVDSGAWELTGREALEAVYLYVKRNFEYLVTPEDMTPEVVGSTGWEYERALRFFRNGGGTCYGYAAAFGLLARLLGEEAHIVAAQVNQYYGDHSFVVIPEDGTDWIYDVELEDARPYRFYDLGLFRVENFAIYNYWYTPDW